MNIFIYVNGILTLPGQSDNWTGRAVTWTHLNTRDRAEKVEYWTGPLSRVLGQRRRARKLAATLEYYRGWNITLAGHSNGCDVIADTLQMMGWPRLARLHLISAACSSDFEKTGLNHVRCPVTVWRARQDWALALAHNPIGRLLGYGTLGLTGPKNAKIKATVINKDFGHSGWFTESQTNETMRRITRT